MATLLQAFQTRTWCSNNLYQTPLTESAAYTSDADTRTGWAGLNQTGTDGLPNGRYVLELRCEKSTRPGKDIKLTLEVGPRGFVNSDAQYPLAYKIFGGGEVTQDVRDMYINASASTPRDGTFSFDYTGGPVVLTRTAEIADGEKDIFCFIWNGGSDGRDNMTAIDRGKLDGEYTNSVMLYLANGGDPDTRIYVYMGEPLPDVPVPHWPTTVNFYPGYGANTPDTQVYQKTFLGYYYKDPSQGEVQYYDENGKGLLNLPYAIDRGLSSSWGTPVINLPAVTREGYSFAGWYTASEGGELAGMAGAEYDLTATESLNLYARWKELTFSWNFNPVTARGNSADSVVRGLWSGFVDGREVLCAACNGYLWELERQENGQWGKTACGAIDTSSDVYMFGFGGNMYLLNGKEYKVWDGTALSDVAGYRPMVAVSVPPAGGGTALEQVNKLCGQRRARFSPDGTAKTFTLPEKGLASVDYVRSAADGSDVTGWSADTANGRVTFTTAPAEGTNSLEIGWTVSGDTAGEIRAMRYAELFNGAQDSRIFVYGDGTNRCFYTGIDFDGLPRADYFPDLNVAHVGDSNTPLTAMIRHYNRLLAFKLDSAWSISYSAITLTDGSVTAGFCVTPVNRSIGNCAPGQAVLVENRPRTLDGRSVVEWRSSSSSGNITGDERNAERISQRVDETIRSFDLSTAKTFYDKYAHEYYVIGADGTALVHGIEADAWYVYTNFDATCLINYKDELYFGTADGQLRHFSDDYFSDEGEPIDAFWESGSMAFDRDFKRKYSAMLWVGIKPEDNGYLAVTAETDRKSDFAEYSFTTGDAAGVPEMNRIRLKAKKFTYYKLKLSNNSADTTATVVSVDIRVRGTGYVR